MKKTLLATLLLFGIIAVGCGEKSSDAASKSDSVDQTKIDYNGKIAFIRMDSLMNGYGMFIDLNDTFTKKQNKAREEITAKGRNLEREMYDYQDKAQKGLVTRYQATTIEEGLKKKDQELTAYGNRIGQELAEEQAVLSNTVSKAILDYIKEYNVDKKYSLILQTMGGNPVIIADPSLDITQDVLSELNRRYQDSLSQKGK